MKKNLSFLILLFISSLLYSQSLTEQLGGIKSNFIISSNNEIVDIASQFIIKRGNYDYTYLSEGGFGYGYESYWLEIQFNTNIKPIEKESSNKRRHFTISLFDKNNQLLLSKSYWISEDQKVKSEHLDTLNQQYFSLNLVDIQIVLLNNVSRIDIMEVFGSKEKTK
ncbi:MAG: hypothetical protein HOK35_15360 [Cytophagia bacterium]|jgi:hypothetical protein|nr:hypothetical protein [Cytophagia bacterium]